MRKIPLSVTHTFIFQPTQACLGTPGSHFELFPFTSYNLCSLNIFVNLLQANYFCISNYPSVCPSGSLILFPAYFFGFLLLSYLCVFHREKFLPAGLIAWNTWVNNKSEDKWKRVCLKISSECLWENAAVVTICVLTYVCYRGLNLTFCASVGILSARRKKGLALYALLRSG